MDLTRIAIDANGGDDAPEIVVDGCLKALEEASDIELILFGDQEDLEKRLADKTYDKKRISIIDAKETIDNNEAPVLAIRRKKDSSIVKGMRYVKDGHADAFVSAGSTGAVLAGGTLIVGRIKGVERPALGSLIPTATGMMLLMDCGANAENKPSHLHQFAKMGSVYIGAFLGIDNPKVGLVNVGAEEKKGNPLYQDTHQLLKADTSINFVGNVEGRDISTGMADVVVADGFTGNIILKHTEGLAGTLMGMVKEGMTSTLVSKIGALLVKGALKENLKKLDYTEYGGAPLLGLEGLVVKAHGSSNAKAFKNAILQCRTFSKEKVNDKIKQHLL